MPRKILLATPEGARIAARHDRSDIGSGYHCLVGRVGKIWREMGDVEGAIVLRSRSSWMYLSEAMLFSSEMIGE